MDLTILTESLPDSQAKPILLSTLRHTSARLPAEGAMPGPPAKDQKRNPYKKRSNWCDNCADCSDCTPSCGRRGSGGCADSLCDCGPGDSGCCDCCPCDGCDCG